MKILPLIEQFLKQINGYFTNFMGRLGMSNAKHFTSMVKLHHINRFQTQQEQHIQWCWKTLNKFQGNNLVWDIVERDESWIYCYDHGNKSQSTQSPFETNLSPQIFKKIALKKMNASFFFCKTGHIAKTVLENRRTFIAHCYTNVCFPKIFVNVEEKRPERIHKFLKL